MTADPEIRATLAQINDRLNTIESQLARIPDLLFLWSSPTAQEVIAALRKANAPPIRHENLMVPSKSTSVARSG
jgi:hypothetical protein